VAVEDGAAAGVELVVVDAANAYLSAAALASGVLAIGAAVGGAAAVAAGGGVDDVPPGGF
jgi:hypothetical protein